MGKGDTASRDDLEPLVDPLSVKVKDLCIVTEACIDCLLSIQGVDIGEETTLALLDEGDGEESNKVDEDIEVGVVFRVLGVGVLSIRGKIIFLGLSGKGILPSFGLGSVCVKEETVKMPCPYG